VFFEKVRIHVSDMYHIRYPYRYPCNIGDLFLTRKQLPRRWLLTIQFACWTPGPKKMATGHHITRLQRVWHLKNYQQSPYTGRWHTQKGYETTRTSGAEAPTWFHSESVYIPSKIFIGGANLADATAEEDKEGTKGELDQIQRY
jgi:hypothetical protein